MFHKISPEHMKIMREYLKKKDAHSFKKFVAIRNDVISTITKEMKEWVSNPELQKKIELEISKEFSKENFKDLYFVERVCQSRYPDMLFKTMVEK